MVDVCKQNVVKLLEFLQVKEMGLFDILASWLKLKKKQANILCIGLDNSGKTTIINQLKPEKSRTINIVPTVGFRVDKFSTEILSFTVFDMSGQGRYRTLWEHYYGKCDAIIFVLDSTDKLRMNVVKEELELLLTHRQIKEKGNLPFLFFANKSDLRQSCSAIKCAQLLGLDTGQWTRGGSATSHSSTEKNSGRPWHICESNALTGDGLDEGIQWLTDQITSTNTR